MIEIGNNLESLLMSVAVLTAIVVGTWLLRKP